MYITKLVIGYVLLPIRVTLNVICLPFVYLYCRNTGKALVFPNNERFIMRDERDNEYRDFYDQWQSTLWHVRDIAHNLPAHLHFETDEEVQFTHRVLAMWPQRLYRDTSRDTGSFPISRNLRDSLIGKGPFHAGKPLTEDDFNAAEKGDIERALYVTKVIFCKNYPRYRQSTDWWEREAYTGLSTS